MWPRLTSGLHAKDPCPSGSPFAGAAPPLGPWHLPGVVSFIGTHCERWQFTVFKSSDSFWRSCAFPPLSHLRLSPPPAVSLFSIHMGVGCRGLRSVLQTADGLCLLGLSHALLPVPQVFCGAGSSPPRAQVQRHLLEEAVPIPPPPTPHRFRLFTSFSAPIDPPLPAPLLVCLPYPIPRCMRARSLSSHCSVHTSDTATRWRMVNKYTVVVQVE